MRLGPWELDRDTRTLFRGEERASLSPRAWDVLLYLAERAGSLVSNEELLERLWHGRVFDETAVRKAVSEIRRALGDDASQPR